MDQFEAAKSGNLQWFKDQEAAGNLIDITSTDNTGKYAHDYAALYNQVALFKYFVSTYYALIEILAKDTSALCFAAENGHVEITEYLLQKYNSIEKLVDTSNTSTSTQYLAFLSAATHGHLDLVQSILENCTQQINLMLPITSLFRTLATENQLSAFKFLNDETDLINNTATEQVIMCNIVATNGHFEFFKYLITQPELRLTTLNFEQLLQIAAANGHLNIVKYLLEDSDQEIDILANDSYAFHYAAANGHLNIVKYLLEDSDQEIDITVDNNSTFQVAVLRGQLEVVRYLTEECTQDINIIKCTANLDNYISSAEQAVVVSYLQPIIKCIEIIGFDEYCKLRHTHATDFQGQLKYTIQTASNAEAIQQLSLIPVSVLKQLNASITGSAQLVAFIANQLQTSSKSKTTLTYL